MLTISKKSTGLDLSALLKGLLDADVKFVLVWGLAAVVQGAPITTMDVDIVPDRSSENTTKLMAFLKTVGALHRRPDDIVIELKENDFSARGHVLLTTRLGPLDILAVIEEGKAYEDLLDHTVDIEFRERTIRVLDLKRLVELKRTSRDPKDKQRLLVLEETLRQLEVKFGSDEKLS